MAGMYKPRFDISQELLRLVTLATEIRVWINSAVGDVSWLPILQRETAARLAHSSTAIEGNPLTLAEVVAIARGEEIGAKTTDKQEILNALAPITASSRFTPSLTVTGVSRGLLRFGSFTPEVLIPIISLPSTSFSNRTGSAITRRSNRHGTSTMT